MNRQQTTDRRQVMLKANMTGGQTS